MTADHVLSANVKDVDYPVHFPQSLTVGFDTVLGTKSQQPKMRQVLDLPWENVASVLFPLLYLGFSLYPITSPITFFRYHPSLL
jgi:hypothetical protein